MVVVLNSCFSAAAAAAASGFGRSSTLWFRVENGYVFLVPFSITLTVSEEVEGAGAIASLLVLCETAGHIFLLQYSCIFLLQYSCVDSCVDGLDAWWVRLCLCFFSNNSGNCALFGKEGGSRKGRAGSAHERSFCCPPMRGQWHSFI